MKDKSVQIRIPKSQIEALVKEAIFKEIAKILKSTKMDEEIKMAVDEAVVDVDLPSVKEKLSELEARLRRLESGKKEKI